MSEFEVRRVPVRPLEKESFGRYGSIIEASSEDDPSLNRAPGHMAFMWVHQFLQYPKPAFIATCRWYYRGTRIDYVQQHPESTVVLVPIDGQPSVVLLMPDHEGEPAADLAEAILLDGRRGIVINPGNWIRYVYPVLATADFAYVSARIDPEDDIRRVYIEKDRGFVFEWYFDAPTQTGVALSPAGAVISLPAANGRDLELGPGGTVIRRSSA